MLVDLVQHVQWGVDLDIYYFFLSMGGDYSLSIPTCNSLIKKETHFIDTADQI